MAEKNFTKEGRLSPYAVRVCARCGKPMHVGRDTYYVTKVEVFAAYDPEEIGEETLARDLRKEIATLCEKLKNVSQEAAEASVYKRVSFFLCPRCQKDYLANPAGR